MARMSDPKADAISLMKSESNFERGGISGQQCRKDAAPRQGVLPAEVHARLMRDIARDQVSYVVFSYQTVIAWVYRNGAVNLPEIKYSKTTSMHQNWVRKAFGGLVNASIPVEPVDGDDPEVQLSDNEAVILRRMRDEDGTEYEMAWGDIQGDIGGLKSVRFVPSDQVEGLRIKGLVTGRAANAYGAMTSVVLTDKGREVLDFLQPVVRKPLGSQYAELGEDDLINLAAQKLDNLFGDDPEAGWEASPDVFRDLEGILRSLKARREDSAPAYARIGEYLRQQGIAEAKYQADLANEFARKSAREPNQDLDEVRYDPYTPAAVLRLSDLQRVVVPTVRDTKAEFFAEQERRLEILLERYQRTMPEKQQNILRCISQGHYSYSSGWGGGSRYNHSAPGSGHDCGDRGNGNTFNALMNRKLTTSRSRIGVHDSTTLMLAKPTTA